ncbi:MAG: hypothetical protein H8D78_20675 [Chloroflexi bacterium]|nr:hypothetical protein [Chloroflexota bacterium]
MEERLRVLKMIEEGTITAEQGAQLLQALQGKGGQEEKEAPSGRGKPPRRLRIRVTDLKSGQHKVNINMPWGLVNVGAKMGARFAPEGIDLEELMAAIDGGAEGKIIDVVDEEDNERVEIFVE